MRYAEQLYNLFKENSHITNPEIAEKLKWKATTVKKYKYLLKKHGFIGVDEVEGIVVLKEYNGSEDFETNNFKQDAYRHLYDICVTRAENEEISTPQLISLIQELRLILKQII